MTTDTEQPTATDHDTVNNRPWFTRLTLGLEVGPTGSQAGIDPDDNDYACDFRGGDVVARCLAAGSDYLVIWARDGDWAYYASSFLPRPPGLRGRDVLRETITAAQPHELPVIAYCVVQQAGLYLDAHPEHAMRTADGEPLPRLCFNSGYADALIAMLDEMLAYGVDGFHIDMIDQGFAPPYGCWCDACQTLFEAEYHHPMPPGPTWDGAWRDMLEFRYATSQRLEETLTDHVRFRDAGATINFNFHVNHSWEVGQRPAQHGAVGDFVSGETGTWAYSALSASLFPEVYRAASKGRPYQVAMQRSVRIYHDQTLRPLTDLRWELLTLRAHGAFVTMIDKTGYDGRLDPVVYRRIGQAFTDCRAREASFHGDPVQPVGLYLSAATRDWYGRTSLLDYLDAIQGAHRALVFDHQAWGIVLDENITADTLARHELIILPNVAVLSTYEVALLTSYVTAGASLIITGWSGQADPDGNLTDTSALSALIGADLVARLPTRDNYLQLSVQDQTDYPRLADGIDPDWPVVIVGDATVYRATTAQTVGKLLTPHRTLLQRRGLQTSFGQDPGFCPAPIPGSADATAGPAILMNQVGSGSVLTFATSPDQATWSEFPIVEARRLLTNAVNHLIPAPPITVEAPAFVETVVARRDQTDEYVVHLIGYSPTPAPTPIRREPTIPRPFSLPGLIEDPAHFTARITLPAGIGSVEVLNPDTSITVDGATATVEVRDVHEAVTLRPSGQP